MNELLEKPAVDLARHIRDGDLSSRELVELYIARAEELNPRLNAIVADRFEHAMEEALAADEAMAHGEELGPLHGVPWTSKEMLSVEGMPVTAGTVHRKGAIATRDATVVQRLRDAGAIVLGVTNQSEMGLWYESYNPVYGRTNNPHDPRRTAGGSSGGEGASVASAMSPFGIGSDMGGSIRIPAFYCGVFGHKPGGGVVPVSGHFPFDFSEHRLEDPPSGRYIDIGPLARHAKDLLPLLQVISGPDQLDPHAVEHAFPEEHVDLNGIRVFLLEDPGMRLASSAKPELKQAVRDAGEALADHGASVETWSGASFYSAMDIYTSVLLAEDSPPVGELIGNGKAPSLLLEFPKMLLGLSRHTLPTLMLLLGDRFVRPSQRAIVRLNEAAENLRREVQAALAEDAVLILPTLPRPAPRHRFTLLSPFDLAYTAIFNALELPVTAVPMGRTSKGMPIGVQIVGGRGRDHLTISAAAALEESGYVWHPPDNR